MTESSTVKNRRIAKNTVLLYVRSFVTMVISLFTSRLILDALGVDNYGVYNVVGGFVGMFSIISGSLSGSVSRYLTYGLGKGDLGQLRVLFATSVNVQLLLSVVIILVGETVGLWFLNNELNIPPERMYAAHWVLQCSILGFVMSLISTPYSACIIAHEKMDVFAYMTILDVGLKLLFVYCLYVTPFDVLITYSCAILIIALIMRVIYGLYCTLHFAECHYRFVFDYRVFKDMSKFAWWSFFGSTAYLFNTHGVNMAVNMFFGVALNAARGIVGQVEGAVLSLVGNFTMAVNPQITKSYASGDRSYMIALVYRGAKFSYFLLLLMLIPLEFEADTVLALWLPVVPEDAALFLRLSLLCSAVTMLGNTSLTAVMATGNIRNYEIVVTLVGCFVFPLTWIAYWCGLPAHASYWVFLGIYNVLNWIRAVFVKRLLHVPVRYYFTKVYWPVILVTGLSLIPAFTIVLLMPEQGLSRLLVMTGTTLLTTSAVSLRFGMNIGERTVIIGKINNFLRVRVAPKLMLMKNSK